MKILPSPFYVRPRDARGLLHYTLGKVLFSTLLLACFLPLSNPLSTLSLSSCSLPIILSLLLPYLPSLFCSTFSSDSSIWLPATSPTLPWFIFMVSPPFIFLLWISLSFLSYLPILPFLLASILLFISPIAALFLRFPFRPWSRYLGGMFSWCEISVGCGHGSASSDPSAHQEEISSLKLEIATAKKLMESADLLSSHLPLGWGNNCIRRGGTCPQDVVKSVTTWMPNQCKKGNGLQQGTTWNLRVVGMELNYRAVFNSIFCFQQ